MSAASQERGGFSPGYSNYVLGVLFVAYVFNFIDRQIPSILLDPIKRDLGLSDTQMGVLTGTAFALFYATLGLPIARLADVWVRRNIIAIGLTLWSLMTALSGLVTSFGQMLAARIGVGVGEAALSPPAHSMLADYFPVERRATALSIYAIGIHVGVLFGVFAGGYLEESLGWRMTFVVVGLPGIAIAILLQLTVREPPRAGPQELPSLAGVFRYLWSLRSFRHVALAAGLTAFGGYSFTSWAPAFLGRVHDVTGSELANKYGVVLGLAGVIGSVIAGLLADRLGRRDPRWWLRVASLATLGPVPFLIVFFLHPAKNVALAFLLPGLILGAMYQGPVFATVQTLARPRMRSVASGLLLFIANLIGLACGPPAVGLLNDHVFAAHGDAAVRYSLIWVLAISGAWALVHFLWATQTLAADLERTRMEDGMGEST